MLVLGLMIVDGCVLVLSCIATSNASTNSFARVSCVIGVFASIIPVIKFLLVTDCRTSYASSSVATRCGSINVWPLVCMSKYSNHH